MEKLVQKVKSRKINIRIGKRQVVFLWLENLEISEDGAGKAGYKKP